VKKIICPLVITLFCAVAFILTDAQSSIDTLLPSTTQKGYVSIDSELSEAKNEVSLLHKINFRAIQHFKTTYPGIINEKWDKLKNGYVANFISNGMYTRNYYDKKGRWLHCLKRYDETKLPDELKSLVKNAYEGYTITIVEEVTTNINNREAIYLIYICDGTIHKIIRACGRELDEISI